MRTEPAQRNERKGRLMPSLTWLYQRGFTTLTLFCLSTSAALASHSGGDMPFVSTINKVKEAVAGPFLLGASVIMIVVTCIMLAFGEWGDGFKKMINIVLWLSIAFAASTFVTTLFGNGAVM
jgi:type IV secretory pathway VirB2 component (pilin)